MNKIHYDVFIIGSGVAGQTVAKACAKEGLNVAVSDNREYGGVCANRGCDPKKVLVEFGELIDFCERMKKNGVEKLPKLNWEKVQEFKQEFTKKVPAKTEDNLKELGIDLYHQSPEFISKSEIKVEGKTVSADKFVIATGKIPQKLDVEGSHYLKTSDDFLEMKSIPESAIFIGAGYIGMEFSHLLVTLGCKVTVIDSGERALSNFDVDLVKELEKKSRTIGIDFYFESEISSIEKLQKNYRVNFKSKKGKTEDVKAEIVFNTAGRIPATKTLNLKKADVSENENGVEVNEYMQSISNKNVYACGDVSDFSLPLTPLSGLTGYVVSKNILKKKSKTLEPPLVPSVVFTLPQMASVGLSEKEAKSIYKDVIVNYEKVPYWYSAKHVNEEIYAYKILINKRTQQIVGAHLVGPKAGEIINLLTLAIKNELRVEDLKKTIFTYPSVGNDIRKMV